MATSRVVEVDGRELKLTNLDKILYPEAGFNAGNAMGRNRYIYALADQALVIDSALRSGGTWEGAVENLQHGWVPMYVRSPGEGAGNAALIAQGLGEGAAAFVTLQRRIDAGGDVVFGR